MYCNKSDLKHVLFSKWKYGLWGGGMKLCDVIFEEGLTFCDVHEGGRVKNRPKSSVCVYGRPHTSLPFMTVTFHVNNSCVCHFLEIKELFWFTFYVLVCKQLLAFLFDNKTCSEKSYWLNILNIAAILFFV